MVAAQIRSWAVGVLVTLASLGARAGAVEPARVEEPGQWSSTAVYLWPGPTAIADAPPDGRIASVWSPDHLRVLMINDSQLVVKSFTEMVSADPVEIESLAEVEWAPSSQAFVVSQSDGGWVGSWSVTAYMITSTGIQARDLTKRVSAEFQSRPGGCSEIPNVAAAGWLRPGVLLVVAEAPPHSSCQDMGAIRGYEVSVTDGKILKRYNEAELRTKYGHHLGLRLRAV